MKLRHSFIFIAGLLAILIFQSCKKTVYNQLDEDQVKFLVYMKGEMIVFAASGAAIDTYFVSDRLRGYAVTKPYYNEIAAVSFYKVNDTIAVNTIGNITVAKDKSDDFEASYVFPHFPDKVILSDMVPVPVDTINGIPVENVYISESDSNSYSLNNHIRKVYYTKEAGFIKLEDIYGNTWYKIN